MIGWSLKIKMLSEGADTFIHGLETAIGAIKIGIEENFTLEDMKDALQNAVDRLKIIHGEVTI